MKKFKKKILIADDNSQNLYLLETLLKSNDYEVITARNGKEALDLSKKEIPDIVISDILMPVMDGFELCRLHKSDEALKKIPFIVYTATYTDQKDEDFALDLGADKFIVKPQKPEVLLQIIREVLENYKNGKLINSGRPHPDDERILKQYNEVLFSKLEKKVIQLENEIIIRKNAEEEIKKILNQKEVLINELFHRTKNNIQLIIALIDLQTKYYKNRKIKATLFDLENRIYSMAIVWNILLNFKDLSKINLKDYISGLAEFLIDRFRNPANIVKLNLTELQDIFILTDDAIPFGLLINELITNSLKHAYPKDKKGEIKIMLCKKPDEKVELIYSDGGIGTKSGFDFKENAKMGIKTIYDIGEKQLKGKINFKNDKGLSCTFTFKNRANNKE